MTAEQLKNNKQQKNFELTSSYLKLEHVKSILIGWLMRRQRQLPLQLQLTMKCVFIWFFSLAIGSDRLTRKKKTFHFCSMRVEKPKVNNWESSKNWVHVKSNWSPISNYDRFAITCIKPISTQKTSITTMQKYIKLYKYLNLLFFFLNFLYFIFNDLPLRIRYAPVFEGIFHIAQLHFVRTICVQRHLQSTQIHTNANTRTLTRTQTHTYAETKCSTLLAQRWAAFLILFFHTVTRLQLLLL